jgi:hypothetical protein
MNPKRAVETSLRSQERPLRCEENGFALPRKGRGRCMESQPQSEGDDLPSWKKDFEIARLAVFATRRSALRPGSAHTVSATAESGINRKSGNYVSVRPTLDRAGSLVGKLMPG